MVLRHEWNIDLGQEEVFGWTDEEKWAVTAQEFLNAPIYAQYTPMSLEGWFAVMKRYPDIYLVTDTKYSSDVESQFQLFVDTALDGGYEEVLSRVIVQIYYEDMYDEVMSVYPFENLIWTLYYIEYPGGQEILDFMTRNKIPVLVMPSSYWDAERQKDLENSDIKVYIHTVNNEEEARRAMEQGVSGIYSDDILPDVAKKWLKD